MADEEKTEETEKKPGLVKKLLLPLALAVIASVGTVAGLKFTGLLSPPMPAAAEAAMADKPMDAEGTHVGKPAFFYTLYPDMLVNFTSDGRAAYLKVAIDIMADDEAVIAGVEQFEAIIRSNLLEAFQSVDFDSTKRAESVASMRELAADQVRGVLENYHGNANIEGVYFTSFVVQ